MYFKMTKVPGPPRKVRMYLKDRAVRAAVSAGVDEASRRVWERMAHKRSIAPVFVVNYHSVPRSAACAFRQQLQWVKSRFEVIDLPGLDGLYSAPKTASSRARALLTFDDGHIDNLEVAAPVLEDLGLRGLFFVVPGFCTEKGYLSAEGITELHRRGHTLGCHTMTHTSLEITPVEALENEIVRSGEMIEEWTSARVDAFAWTFAWNRITPKAWKLIRESYCYCFTPCPGVVIPGKTAPHILWRANVEANYPATHYRFMFSGMPSVIWTKQRRWLEEVFLRT